MTEVTGISCVYPGRSGAASADGFWQSALQVCRVALAFTRLAACVPMFLPSSCIGCIVDATAVIFDMCQRPNGVSPAPHDPYLL